MTSAEVELIMKTIAASGVQVAQSIDEMRKVIKDHNGRLRTVEQEQVRQNGCIEELKEIPAKVRTLEDESLSNVTIKKYTALLFGGGIALGGLIIGILQLLK